MFVYICEWKFVYMCMYVCMTSSYSCRQYIYIYTYPCTHTYIQAIHNSGLTPGNFSPSTFLLTSPSGNVSYMLDYYPAHEHTLVFSVHGSSKVARHLHLHLHLNYSSENVSYIRADKCISCLTSLHGF